MDNQSKPDINRIAIVLKEKKMTIKQLAERLGKDYSGVAKNSRNETQPSLQDLVRIAEILQVDVRQLLHPTMP